MQTVSIIIGVIVLIFGVGYVVTNTNQEPAAVALQSSSSEVASDQPSPTEADTNANTTPGVYAAYDADVVAQSDADHILLFFEASWCPSCRALDADIVANLNDIPAGVEIYTVDYDTATDLKRRYKVTTQHSIIKIAADGTAQSGITHGLTLDNVLATI